MKNFTKIFSIIILLIFSAKVSAETFAVIVNKNNSFDGEIRNYYLLKMGFDQWQNGEDVIPFDLNANGNFKKVLARLGFLKFLLI